MKKGLLLLFIFSFIGISAFSQVQLTQYMLDGSMYNPAFVGSRKAICGNLIGRQQWLGFEDSTSTNVSPRSFMLNVHAPVYSINSGVGINVISDRLGYEQNLGVKLNYAYRFVLGDNQSLAAGLGLSFLNKSIDFSELVVEDPSDPLLKYKDKQSTTFVDIDLGVYYQFVDKAYAGISATNLLQSSREIGNVDYKQKMNLYLTGGYYIQVYEMDYKKIYLVPSLLLKTNFSSTQFDINLLVNYNKQYWGGFSYRYQDAVAVMAGFQLSGFRLGVSYDITTSTMSNSSAGSLEVFFGYCYPIKPKIKPKSLYNTRYL